VDAVTRAIVDLHIGLDGRRDLCGQVCRQIRAAILDGRLLPGQALPSSRELAHPLALARNTSAWWFPGRLDDGTPWDVRRSPAWVG
jgi:hypothetical protein